MSFSPSNSQAPYLQTSIFFPDNFEEFRIKFLEIYRNIANATNSRGISVFDLQEFLTGEQWFTSNNPQIKRQTFRRVYSIGAIAAGGTLNTAHGLTNVSSYTKIIGTVITGVPDNRPIPFVSATVVTDQIEIRIDGTNIIIVNGATAPNITSGLVVLEYLKN